MQMLPQNHFSVFERCVNTQLFLGVLDKCTPVQSDQVFDEQYLFQYQQQKQIIQPSHHIVFHFFAHGKGMFLFSNCLAHVIWLHKLQRCLPALNSHRIACECLFIWAE